MTDLDFQNKMRGSLKKKCKVLTAASGGSGFGYSKAGPVARSWADDCLLLSYIKHPRR